MKALASFVVALAAVLSADASAWPVGPDETPAVVRAALQLPDSRIDLAREKLIFDRLYDPNTDVEASLRQIDAMSKAIAAMAGRSAPARQRLAALRKYVYESGPWNANKPFRYDLSDPMGSKPWNRLLSTYLRTHRGNCVSMPILFAALAQRLDLNATLSTAPNHMFVKYTDDITGKTVNLETTSGAYPARDAYIRQNMPMTDAAIANGLYMKALSKKEALVVIAGIVIEREMADEHYQTAWDVAELLRPYYADDPTVLLTPADAALGLVRDEYLRKYPHKSDIPPEKLGRLHVLEQAVSNALNHAHALGWRQTDGEEPSPREASAAGTQASTSPQP